jgi:DNA polymerase III delta subunit
LPRQAVQLLAANVGNDLAALRNEIEKLLLYAGPEATIATEDVVRLSPYAAATNIFDLVDALGSRRPAQAAVLFQRELNEGEDPFRLFAMFIRQFRLLIQTRSLLDAGERPGDVAKLLKQHPRVAEKLVAAGARLQPAPTGTHLPPPAANRCGNKNRPGRLADGAAPVGGRGDGGRVNSIQYSVSVVDSRLTY